MEGKRGDSGNGGKSAARRRGFALVKDQKIKIEKLRNERW